MTDPAVWDEERAYLQGVTGAIEQEERDIDKRFERGFAMVDEASEVSLTRMLENRYRVLKRAEGSPYFARIDFDEDPSEALFASSRGKTRQEKIYIGKTSVYDGESNLLVTDWRAPVSALYYDSRPGPASYDSPEGLIKGNLKLKRRLTIERGVLTGCDDIDITAADELLAPYLSVSADTRLKNIIATIQTEQNSIIRAPRRRHLIVQGAAGSGKTTVALHRVAYLAYTMGKRFRPEQFLVLSAGGFFLGYIAGILPDLGVEDVPQSSFEELVKKTARASFQLTDPNETETDGGRYKSSYEILSDIDSFLAAEPELCGKKTSALTAYRRFLEQTGRSAAKNKLDFDDLAPLLYMRIRTAGISIPYVQHVVIDEAQDFSPMQITVLQTLFKKASFTILGDLAQGITPHGLTGGWEDLNREVWQGGASVLRLQKSYRATMQIMEAANRVLDRLPDLPKGEAVIRSGEPVTYSDVWGEGDRADACARLICRRAAQGHKSIAVILSRQPLCREFERLLNKTLKMDGRRVSLLPWNNPDENGVCDPCLLPAALAKGLEFDCVIVADAERYPKDSRGTKLLYVAMTRAMHTLDMVYEGECPI